MSLVAFGPVHLVAILHVLMAGTLTAHALLFKRDVRASIGWIGLAWLSPVVGVILYYVFGINRVTRRASRLARGGRRGASARPPADDAARFLLPENIGLIARVGAEVTGRGLAPGNTVACLHGGDEAYPAMLAAIAAAHRSIALASYIFRADRTGLAFVEALAAARARGVEIRVLIDGIGSGYLYSGAQQHLTAAGVPVARFLHDWLPWRMPFLNLRNHKKLLIVDGGLGFTGGLNIGAENLLSAEPGSVRDVHFRLSGPVVGQLLETFAEDWNFITGESLAGDAWWPAAETKGAAGPVLARGVASGPDEDLGKIEMLLRAALGQARRRLRIVTPYFLPDQPLMNDLALAALRGVEVDIVLPEKSNHRVFDWALHAHLGLVATPGLRFHWAPPPFDHAKLMTVDGSWSLVGSPNWDVRSTRLNFEFAVECYDPAFAASLDRLIDAKIARAGRRSPAELAHPTLPIRLRNAAARLLLPYL